MSGISDDRPRLYLLHRLAEADAVQFEESILEEDGCADRLREAEDDLLDDYAAGRLSVDERGAVEQFLLHSPDGRQRLQFAHALAAMPRESGGNDAAHVNRRAAADESSTARDGPSTFLARKWIAPVGLLIAASVAFVLLLVPASRRPGLPGALPDEMSKEAPSASAPDTVTRPAGQSTPYTVLLLAETQRGSDAVQRVSIPLGAAQVQLQLEVADSASGGNGSATYRVTVRDSSGQELFASGPLAARQVAAYRIVETTVPLQALGIGERRVFVTRVERDAVLPVFDWEINLRVGDSAP